MEVAALARSGVTDKSVSENYDVIASAYADNLYDELKGKPLDRHLLNRFAEEVGEGKVADVGCGPGQIARYLREQGVNAIGIDLSQAMVRLATQLNSNIEFRAGDMLALDLPDASLAGVVAFYSIIHLEPSQIPAAFREFHRVLASDGVLLVAFHVGDDTHHVDEMWGHEVSLDFHFLRPAMISGALEASGFVVSEAIEREPYEGAEHPSRRCYLFARKKRTG